MINTNIFVTEYYKVLKLIYSHQVELAGEIYSPVTQEEIGKELGFSKVKANSIVKELIEKEFITCLIRGKYIVTDAGIEVLKKINL